MSKAEAQAEVQALLKDYGVELDQQSVNEGKVVGTGAYGTVINVKVNGAPCVAKRIHDILLGIRGFEPVGIDQWLPMLKSFAKECKLLGKMRHPNVVQFIGVCELDPREPRTLALVMEKLHTDLAKYIEKTRGHIPLPSKLIILHGTSSGLLYLHSHKVVHRDLNARNVLLTESLQAKVADLGVARVMETMSTARNLTRTPGCLEYMPPEALMQNPVYDVKLDCFSFGHLMLYLTIEQDPAPYDPTYDSQHPRTSMSVDYQIQKRQTWIDKMDQGHCLYNLVTSCLRDLPKNRPEMHEINQRLESLCKAHPQEKQQSENIDQTHQLLEQLTEIKETTGKLMSEPMEMSALHKHVSDLEEQHAREAEKIQQTKEQVQFSQELLKRRSENIQALSSQMQALETQMLQHLDDLGGGDETARCTELEEQVHRMQEENAAKDSELDSVKDELQHVREELQQVSEESQKNIDDLTVVLQKAEMDCESLREEKNAELADKNRQIDLLQTQVRAESEAHTQVGKLLREQSAELDNARMEVHRMQEENAAKDSELDGIREELQHVKEENQQLSEETQKTIGNLTVALQKAERDCTCLQEEKDAELANNAEQIDRLERQVKVESEACIQANELLKVQSAELDYARKEVHRMEEENVAKDSELQSVREELQHVREELQQLSEQDNKKIDDLTMALRNAETEYTSLREEKNAELADKVEQVDHLETQVKAEIEARLQAGELLRERSAELDNARKENSELQLINEVDSQKRSAQSDEVHKMREENAAKDSELQSVREELQHVREELQQLTEENRKSVGDLTPVPRETEKECASLQEEKNAVIKAESEAYVQVSDRKPSAELDNARKENCELQMNIDGHKSEADAQKRSAALDEDQCHNGETNQAQKKPKSATLPPVPLKRSATLPRRNVQRPYNYYAQGSSETTKHPALIPSSAEVPKPVHHTEPGLATGLNKTLVYDSKLSDILERRRQRSESNAQTNTTSNQSGPTSSSARQPIRSRPLSVIEDVGGTFDDELKRKLQKWKVQAEGIDLSKEKDQADLPQTNTQM